MIITSNRTHTMTYPYHDNDGTLRKVTIKPGDNEVDEKAWRMVEKAFKDRSPAYFKGIKKGDNK